jgi:hypothetical protein
MNTNTAPAPEYGKFVCSRPCVNFLAKLQMAWEALEKGYDVAFTKEGVDIYEKAESTTK